MLSLLLLWSLCVSAHPTFHWASRIVSQTYDDARLIAEEPSVRYSSSFFEETSHPDEKLISAAANVPVSEVVKFKDQTQLENLAARSNGQLVLTSISDTKLRLLDPSKKNSKAQTIYTFPEATSLSGVVEASPDVFAIVAGNWSIKTYEGVKGSFVIWLADFNEDPPSVKQIAKIPEAASLNGIAVHPSNDNLVLIADSDGGAIWRVDTSTGDYDVALRDPLFTNCTSPFPLGLNGITTYEGKLYFANSALLIYGRVPIDEHGAASGEIEILGRAVPQALAFDDLVIDWAGNAYIATHPNVVTQITLEGKQRNFTGTDVEMANPTSITWGRGSPEQEKILYVVTNGQSGSGKGFVGAQVIAVDTRLL